VYPEELSLCETIHTFGSARFVIGPHGAGWTNALFSLPSAKGLLWTWLGTRRDNWYANVAAISGMNLQIHETNGINGNRFDMDPTVLESKLSDLLDREHR
jgi:capsular polysaccharide biosynthesis protein